MKLPFNMQQKSSEIAQKGSALFVVFIGIALFAALGFAVSSIMRQGDPTAVTGQKAGLYGDQILDYTRGLRQALQNVTISSGCGDTEVNFTVTGADGYQHSPVGRDECKIFHSAGGGMTNVAPDKRWLATSLTGSALYGEWYFSGNDAVAQIGDDGTADLILFLPWADETLCQKVNESLGHVAKGVVIGPEGWVFSTASKFTGSYGAGTNKIGVGATQLSGKPAGCVTDSNGRHFVYQVLIAR